MYLIIWERGRDNIYYMYIVCITNHMSYKINKIKFIVYQMMIRTIKKIKQGKGMVRLREV